MEQQTAYGLPMLVDVNARQKNFDAKVHQVRCVLNREKYFGCVLSTSHNFAWLTGGGRNYVLIASDGDVGSIYIDQEKVVLITNNIEGHRLLNEELHGLHISSCEDNWYEQRSLQEITNTLSLNQRVIIDSDATFEGLLAILRRTLSPFDQLRLQSLGAECGKIISEVAHSIRPNMTEFEIAGQISTKCLALSIDAVVLLIAADERLDSIRHPLPTMKKVRNKVMLVLCGRRGGLIASITRLVSISVACTSTEQRGVPEVWQRKHKAACYVDALAISLTKLGMEVSELFKRLMEAYTSQGFDSEWKFHHQGGLTGYKSREYKADMRSDYVIDVNQAFAWNPSIAGTKSEDTILLDDQNRIQIITASPNWPMIHVEVNGQTIARPEILHLKF